MAGAAHDSGALRQAIADKRALAVIPSDPSRSFKHPLGKQLYAHRHLVEWRFSTSSSFDAPPPASRKPRATTAPSSHSPPSYYGCGDCTHCLIQRREINGDFMHSPNAGAWSLLHFPVLRVDARLCRGEYLTMFSSCTTPST